MSCWYLGKAHIDYLIGSALTLGDAFGRARWQGQRIDLTTADEVGAALRVVNGLAFFGRYAHKYEESLDELCATFAGALTYRFPGPVTLRLTDQRPTYDPVVTLKALDCYEYQAGDWDGYEGSAAEKFCVELRGQAIAALPGYDAAPWGIDEGE